MLERLRWMPETWKISRGRWKRAAREKERFGAAFRGDGPMSLIVADSPLEQPTDRLRSRKSEIHAPLGIFDDASSEHGFEKSFILGVGFEDEFVRREPYSSNVDRDRRIDFAIQLVDELDCHAAMRVFVE